MSGEPGVPVGGGDQRELAARLRAVIEAKDAESAVLRPADPEAPVIWVRAYPLIGGCTVRRLPPDL